MERPIAGEPVHQHLVAAVNKWHGERGVRLHSGFCASRAEQGQLEVDPEHSIDIVPVEG